MITFKQIKKAINKSLIKNFDVPVNSQDIALHFHNAK